MNYFDNSELFEHLPERITTSKKQKVLISFLIAGIAGSVGWVLSVQRKMLSRKKIMPNAEE
jgi:hypothetical protein